MEQKSTLEQALTELLTPIIEKAIDGALARHQVIKDVSSGSDSALNEIFDVNALVKYLKVKRSTIYAMTSGRKIIHYKRGGKLYFYKTDVDGYIQQGRVKTYEEIEKEANDYVIRNPRKSF